MALKMLTATVLIAAGAASVHGQRLAPAVAALDFYEIQQIDARWCHELDSAGDNGNAFASVFASDGVLITATGRHLEGREQIAAFAKEDPDKRKGPTNVGHYVTNLTVEQTASGVRAHGYLLEATMAPPPANGRGRGPVRAVTEANPYWEDLVRTPEGWRIKMRVIARPGGPAPTLPAADAPSPAASMTMPHPFSAQDYADIDQLFALFGYGFDSAADNGYQWASLYTPDGVFVAGSALQSMKGRDTLAAFASNRLTFGGGFASITLGPGAAKNPLAIQHILTDVVIDPVADGAVARVYRLNATIGNDGVANLAPGGVYHVLLVRTPDGWRFKENWYAGAGAPVQDGAKRFLPAAGAAPVAAPPRGASPAITVTAEDDAAIRQLYARFSQAMDSGAENGAALSRLFTSDGVLLDTWTSKVYTGSEQIAALARANSGAAKGPTNLNHFIWTVKVEPSAQGATAKAYVMTGTAPDGTHPLTMNNAGQYWDDLVKTSDGWRIRKRTFYRVSQIAPPPQTAALTPGGAQ